MTRTRLILLLPFVAALAGCTSSNSSAFTRAPDDNWAGYSGKTVTVQGTAANTSRGPIVRLSDGGYVALNQRQPWGYASGLGLASREVEVSGTIVGSEGLRVEPWVLDAQSVKLLAPPEKKPDGPAGP